MSDIPILVAAAKLAVESLVYAVDMSGEVNGATVTDHDVSAVSGGTVGATEVSAEGIIEALLIGGTAETESVYLYLLTLSDGQTIACYVVVPVLGPP